MACNHRFINDLIPNYPIKYLFVGTFNPSWNNLNGNNANWFYGRRTNSFWNIMPRVFDNENLNNKHNRLNPTNWKEYCVKNRIGITDLITSIIDADETNEIHVKKIRSFLDNDIESFKQFDKTEITNIIGNNLKTIKGVYLTRYAHGLKQNGILSQSWNEISLYCQRNKIQCDSLVTPSNGYRKPVIEKIKIWKEIIKS